MFHYRYNVSAMQSPEPIIYAEPVRPGGGPPGPGSWLESSWGPSKLNFQPEIPVQEKLAPACCKNWEN